MKLLEKIRKNSQDKFEKMKKKINVKKNYTISFEKINKEHKLILTENKKVKLIGDFNFYGIYNEHTQMWVWANAIPDVLLSQIKQIEELRAKAYVFEKNIDTSEINVFFYQLNY